MVNALLIVVRQAELTFRLLTFYLQMKLFYGTTHETFCFKIYEKKELNI